MAQPNPTSQSPSFIDRGSGLRLLPAEYLYAFLITFLQMATAEPLTTHRVLLRVVAQPQIHGIHTELMGELVERAFQSEHVGQLGR